jgi:taurine transport system permease protein
LTLVGTLVLWYVLTTVTQVINPMVFPTPGEAWDSLMQIATTGYGDGRLDQHIAQSVKLVVLGFLAAVAIGVPLGLSMGYSRRAEAFFNPVFSLIRPIPPLAWIPLAIVWLGLGDAAKILVIWMAAFVPAVINSYAGVRNIDAPMLEAAQMLGVKPFAFVREVLIPGASPMIFTGLRLSLQAAWTTLVAGELVGSLLGLGHVLTQGSLDIYPSMILVAMLTIAALGWLMTWVLGVIERRVMPWRAEA